MEYEFGRPSDEYKRPRRTLDYEKLRAFMDIKSYNIWSSNKKKKLRNSLILCLRDKYGPNESSKKKEEITSSCGESTLLG